MVLIKTEEFDNKFNKDLKQISINHKKPLQLKGSHKIKEYGSIITDIDLTANVYYNEGLLKSLASILTRLRDTSKEFTFIHMGLGKYFSFKTPWDIDDNGSCRFDIEEARLWFEEFKNKNLVPNKVLERINDILYSENILLKDLIEIDSLLSEYSEIIWNLEDIDRGYIDDKYEKDETGNFIRYDLLELLLSGKRGVLKYIYYYKGDMIPVDVGVVDKYYVSKNTGMAAYTTYYSSDIYKMFKLSYKWRIKEEYRPEFFKRMDNISLLLAVKYKVNLLIKINRYKLFTKQKRLELNNSIIPDLQSINIVYKGKSLPELKDEITKIIEEDLKDVFEIFPKYLKDEYVKENTKRYLRGLESQIPTNVHDMYERTALGIKCPFFKTNIEDFDILLDISFRSQLEFKKLSDCFYSIALKFNIPVETIIREIIKDNGLSITDENGIVILKKNGIEVGKYLLKDKPILQAKILVSD